MRGDLTVVLMLRKAR